MTSTREKIARLMIIPLVIAVGIMFYQDYTSDRSVAERRASERRENRNSTADRDRARDKAKSETGNIKSNPPASDSNRLMNKTIGEVTNILGNGLSSEVIPKALGDTDGLMVRYSNGTKVLFVRGIAVSVTPAR